MQGDFNQLFIFVISSYFFMSSSFAICNVYTFPNMPGCVSMPYLSNFFNLLIHFSNSPADSTPTFFCSKYCSIRCHIFDFKTAQHITGGIVYKPLKISCRIEAVL